MLSLSIVRIGTTNIYKFRRHWGNIYVDVNFLFQVAYVTAVFPYLVLTILFFKGVTLDGAGDGVEFLFKPDVSSFNRLSWQY